MYLVVIEINSEVIKIIQAQSVPKGFSVDKILAYPVVGLSAEACTSSLNKIINQHSIKIDKLIALVPRRDLTIRILKFPSSDKVELQQMASFEAIKQIPFPQEEIFFDYRKMETTEDGYSEVILSIVHKNVVNRIMDILTKNALKPDIITATTEGLYLWAKTALPQEIKAHNAILIMDIDRNNVEMEVIAGEKILLSRTSSFGKVSLAESAIDYQTHQERLLLEVKRSIDVYNKEQKQNLPIEKIVITGATDIARSITGMFRDRLGIETTVAESTKAFPVDSNAFIKDGIVKDVSISSCLGALFALSATYLNILPPQLKRKQDIAQKSKKVIILSLLAFCLFAMLGLGVSAKFLHKKILLSNIKSSIKKVGPFSKELEIKFKKIEFMRSHTEAAKRPLTFLYELHRVIPQDVLLSYLSFGNKGKITLQGTTPAMPNVFEFVNMLEKSEKFKNVQTIYVSKRRLKDRETVDFQITCELSI